jgi:hypothetical protein
MLFMIGVSFFFGFYVYDYLKAETTLFNSAEDGGSDAQSEIRTSMDVTTNMLSYIFIMVLASMVVLIVLTAHFIDSSGVFLVVGFIVLIVTLIVSVPFSNAYESISNEDTFSGIKNSFDTVIFINTNLHYFVLIIGAAMLVILYGKKSSGGGWNY